MTALPDFQPIHSQKKPLQTLGQNHTQAMSNSAEKSSIIVHFCQRSSDALPFTGRSILGHIEAERNGTAKLGPRTALVTTSAATNWQLLNHCKTS